MERSQALALDLGQDVGRGLAVKPSQLPQGGTQLSDISRTALDLLERGSAGLLSLRHEAGEVAFGLMEGSLQRRGFLPPPSVEFLEAGLLFRCEGEGGVPGEDVARRGLGRSQGCGGAGRGRAGWRR